MREVFEVDDAGAGDVSWRGNPMSETSSYIHSHRNTEAGSPPQRAKPAARTRGKRLRGCVVAGVCWSLLGVAVWLRPHESGTGTHEELGLPACAYLARTGLPWPTCGLTTSVSAMAHGRFALAWRAHPFGVALFVAAVISAFVGGAEALTGRDVWKRLRPRPWWVLVGIAALMVSWLGKLALGLADGSLPAW